MGALTDKPHPALRIQYALDELTSGNSLEYLRLQHTLRGTNPTTLSPILSGLTHFAVKLHHDDPQKPLHTLFKAALQIDLPTIASHQVTLTATATFLRNLVSADASFVEPVLVMLTRAFLLPVEIREAFMEEVHNLINFLLSVHPRAAALVVSILRERYPHPVRPAEEHAPYLRGVLSVCRNCPLLMKPLTNIVYERVAAVEALVPYDGLFVDDALEPEAEKMDVILQEMFRHFELAKGKPFLERIFEPAFDAYESYVVPCEARFTPYIILHGASMGGDNILYSVIERLRVTFFDRGISARVREKFLEHSCGLLIRAKNISREMTHKWLDSMATWLHGYIDNTIRRGSSQEVDADVHHIFYTGVAAWVRVVTKRREYVTEDSLAGWRVGRIVGCGMRPLIMLDERICREFLTVAGDSVVFDVDWAYRPTRTRYGAPNVFEFADRLPDLELPVARDKIQHLVRWDHEKQDAQTEAPEDMEI